MSRSKYLNPGNSKPLSRSTVESPSTLDIVKSSRASPLPSTIPAQNSLNRAFVSGQRKRIFLQLLEEWSLCHDSSPHFHGKLSLQAQGLRSEQSFEFGESVSCILTDTSFTDARKKIVIRLFPPPGHISKNSMDTRRQIRHDSMDADDTDRSNLRPLTDVNTVSCFDKNQQPQHIRSNETNRYCKLVVRCGAGWVSAREYFSKLYFARLEAQRLRIKPSLQSLDSSLEHRSKLLGPPPLPDDTVTIRPLFRPFKRLPPELQEMILTTAAGLSKHYNMCHDGHRCLLRRSEEPSPTSLSTMFRISKRLDEHLIPHIYRSTDFHFGLTGFTNFLWQAGPVNRPEIRRLTFHFGKLALLHCIRWLAPDSVFELLEPPVVTNPRSLQYFWRCQIQDLAREVRLRTLTVDIRDIPEADLAMIVRILRSVFGDVGRVQFIETSKDGKTKELGLDVQWLAEAYAGGTWREMCAGYWERHKSHQYYFKVELMRLEKETFQTLMDLDQQYLDQ